MESKNIRSYTPIQGSKSLPKRFVRSLKGKPKFTESCGTPMKVYLRVRPYTKGEKASGESSHSCLEIENSSSVMMHPPKDSFTFKNSRSNCDTALTVHRFGFSHVFGPETDQESFFKDTTLNVVHDFVRGQNCLMFSYGVTNAGKTYTIHGTSKDIGILPRTFHLLFSSFQDKIYKRTNLKPKVFSDIIKLGSAQESKEDSKKKALLGLFNRINSVESLDSLAASSSEVDTEFCVHQDSTRIDDLRSLGLLVEDCTQFAFWISFAEIYNEQIFDLLEPTSSEKDKRPTLKLGDDKNGNPYIKGLRHVLVANADEAYKVLKIGQRNQRNASTRLNKNSSRSHCVFNLKLAKLNVRESETQVIRVSQLSFVDLAGSERYTKTQNTGERLKEAGNINTSIMTLGKCVELLRYNQSHTSNPKNIPFRESKLTRLFQVYFCGQGNISMIVNISPCTSAFDETLHALKFSAVARKVVTVDFVPLSKESLPENDSEQLHSIIKTLQTKLTDVAMKSAMMELKIREEVSHEFSEQMTEIENMYSKRLMDEQDMNEEVFEKRFELLTNSVRKMRRRPCTEIFEDNEKDEWVSSILLHREQVKIKEKDQIIQCLEATIEKQKNIIEKQRNVLDYLRPSVEPGRVPHVSLSEEQFQKSFEDVLLCSPSTPTTLMFEDVMFDEEDCKKLNKRKIFKKLGGLVDSGSSISRSAKKLKKRIFDDPVSSSSEESPLKKGWKRERKASSSKKYQDPPKKSLRSRKV